MECTNARWEVGETALAHNLGNSTEQAYARTDLFEQRRALMEAWAAHLAEGNAANQFEPLSNPNA